MAAFPHKHLIDLGEYSADDIMTILATADTPSISSRNRRTFSSVELGTFFPT